MKINRTNIFADWLNNLKDKKGKALILINIDRMEKGNMGKAEPVGKGVYEKKIDFGPGYRMYFTKKGKEIILLLCGGDKSTQKLDIKKAIKIKEGLT